MRKFKIYKIILFFDLAIIMLLVTYNCILLIQRLDGGKLFLVPITMDYVIANIFIIFLLISIAVFILKKSVE